MKISLSLRNVIALALVAATCWFWGSQSAPGVTAQAPPSRIAVIDVQKVISQSASGKASVAKLKQLQEERVAKARQMDGELRTLDAEFKKPGATPAQRNALQKQLEEKSVAIKRYAEDAEREMGQARDRELAGLDARVKPIVDALGKEMQLAGIFNKFESGLLYAADAIDITDAVIKRFDTSPAAAPATPATRPARP
jgi:Skp family chaperone for outer membrane proteins